MSWIGHGSSSGRGSAAFGGLAQVRSNICSCRAWNRSNTCS